MVDRERLFLDERAGWRALQGALAAIEPGRRSEPSVPPGGWSVDITLHHVGAWLDLCGDVLERISAGSWDPATAPEEAPGFVDRWNAEQVERARALTPDAVDVFVARARERALAAFEALPDVDRDAWNWFEESGPMHYAEHVHDLVAWNGGVVPDPDIGPLLREETDAWVALAAGLDAVSPHEATEQGEDGWSTHDAVYHLASWIGLAADAVAKNRYWYPGPIPAPEDEIESRNVRFLADGRLVQPAAARESLERARTRMRAALSALAEPSAEAKRTFEMNTTDHYREHLEAVQRFLEGTNEVRG
jgi:hypothetical protein